MDRNEAASRLYRIESRKGLDFFNLAEADKMSSRALNDLSGNRSGTHPLLELMKGMGVHHDGRVERRKIALLERRDIAELRELRDRLMGILDERDRDELQR